MGSDKELRFGVEPFTFLSHFNVDSFLQGQSQNLFQNLLECFFLDDVIVN